MIHFTEKLKGTEKVVMQVLHVVMTYDCKENTCNEIKSKKNTHNYIIVYISENIGWAEYIVCPPNIMIGWAAAHPAP